MQMKQLFQEHGYAFYLDSPTNQQFVILPNEEITRLSQKVQFTHWGPYDNHHTICRFVTSWATTDEDLQALKGFLTK
jgi:threonine aldolase